MVENHLSALSWGVAIITEEDGIIQVCNDAFKELPLHNAEDPTGRRLEDMFGESCHAIRNAFFVAVRQQKAVHLTRAACVTPNGDTRYYNVQARLAHWSRRPAIMLSVWDISSNEEARQRFLGLDPQEIRKTSDLIRSRSLLLSLMDHVPEGIAVMDLVSNRLTWVSRYGCELLGVSRDRLLEIPLDRIPDLLYLYHLDGETRAVGEEMPLLRAAREVIREEVWILRQPERPAMHIVISAGPILNAAGSIIGTVIVWHDVSRLHEAEQQAHDYAEKLERSNRDLQDFASVVSHDLQEPLRKVRMFGNMLIDRYGERLDAEGQDLIERMQSASERMQQMIDKLLAYSRVSTQARPFASVDLGKVAADVLVDLEGRLQESGGSVEIGSLPVIQADEMQMQQLFQNLIANALKYHRPGIPPVVRIAAEPAASHEVEIMVQDNGIGFDISYLEFVFKPFSRLHGRGTYEGTGIGLAICRRIVERHGGSITATSTPGEGSTFIVRLPTRQQIAY